MESLKFGEKSNRGENLAIDEKYCDHIGDQLNEAACSEFDLK